MNLRAAHGVHDALGFDAVYMRAMSENASGSSDIISLGNEFEITQLESPPAKEVPPWAAIILSGCRRSSGLQSLPHQLQKNRVDGADLPGAPEDAAVGVEQDQHRGVIVFAVR